MHATDIVGYTFNAETLCPSCMRRKAAFENEANGDNAEFTPLDTLLTRWAARQGIVDMEDEHSFDSDDFPKVIFASSVEDRERCDGCNERLDGEPDVICAVCAEHGMWNCRETVATCDRCGVRKDVFAEMDYSTDDNGVAIDTVCLDCLSIGQHLKSAHPERAGA